MPRAFFKILTLVTFIMACGEEEQPPEEKEKKEVQQEDQDQPPDHFSFFDPKSIDNGIYDSIVESPVRFDALSGMDPFTITREPSLSGEVLIYLQDDSTRVLFLDAHKGWSQQLYNASTIQGDTFNLKTGVGHKQPCDGVEMTAFRFSIAGDIDEKHIKFWNTPIDNMDRIDLDLVNPDFIENLMDKGWISMDSIWVIS